MKLLLLQSLERFTIATINLSVRFKKYHIDYKLYKSSHWQLTVFSTVPKNERKIEEILIWNKPTYILRPWGLWWKILYDWKLYVITQNMRYQNIDVYVGCCYFVTWYAWVSKTWKYYAQ